MREDMPAAAPWLHSAKNRCGMQLRADGVSVGVKKPVWEPQNGFDSTAREDTMLTDQTEYVAKVAGAGHLGNVS